jgi:hypothetical protein
MSFGPWTDLKTIFGLIVNTIPWQQHEPIKSVLQWLNNVCECRFFQRDCLILLGLEKGQSRSSTYK